MSKLKSLEKLLAAVKKDKKAISSAEKTLNKGDSLSTAEQMALNIKNELRNNLKLNDKTLDNAIKTPTRGAIKGTKKPEQHTMDTLIASRKQKDAEKLAKIVRDKKPKSRFEKLQEEMKQKSEQKKMGVMDKVSSFTDAPARSGLRALLRGKNPLDAISDSAGKDPKLAPTGVDIAADDLGIENPYLGAAVGTAIDVVADPTNLIPVGKAGKFLGTAGAKSADILSKLFKK